MEEAAEAKWRVLIDTKQVQFFSGALSHLIYGSLGAGEPVSWTKMEDDARNSHIIFQQSF